MRACFRIVAADVRWLPTPCLSLEGSPQPLRFGPVFGSIHVQQETGFAARGANRSCLQYFFKLVQGEVPLAQKLFDLGQCLDSQKKRETCDPLVPHEDGESFRTKRTAYPPQQTDWDEGHVTGEKQDTPRRARLKGRVNSPHRPASRHHIPADNACRTIQRSDGGLDVSEESLAAQSESRFIASHARA